MKRIGQLVIASALAATSGAAAAPGGPTVRVSELSPDRFELVYSGTTFSSRDAVERQLLLDSARLAIAHGRETFVLLALRGERADVHPARPNPGFGAGYGHWQPHWNYYLPQDGWQWWHPEWDAAFWTAEVDPTRVKQFEAHAMIELRGRGEARSGETLAFFARDVVRDLGRPPGVVVPHQAP